MLLERRLMAQKNTKIYNPKAYSSEHISDFLNYIRSISQLHNMAIADEQEANKSVQDLLHLIELEDKSHNQLGHIGKQIRDIRRSRREAKDAQRVTSVLVDWVDKNKAVIKDLEQLLGSVRKAESTIANRSYYPRTDMIERIDTGDVCECEGSSGKTAKEERTGKSKNIDKMIKDYKKESYEKRKDKKWN